MPNAVQVVFNADTGQYVAGIDKATGATTKQAQAVADAKNKILGALKEQAAAAKENGASAEELTRIHTKAAESMANVNEKNANRVIAALDRIIEKRKRVAEELKNLPEPPAASHGDDITNKQRASAVLRGGGIRAGEAFLTQFDAFNKLSTMVFPVLGVATLAEEGWKAYQAFKELYKTAEALPGVLKDDFGDLNGPLELGVDNLRKVNDELEITNAHLQHKDASKPGAALAIDEIRIAADNAAAAARKAFLDVKKLLDENKSGALQKLLFDQGETGGVSDDIQRQMKHVADLQRANVAAVRSGQDTPAAQAARDKELADAKAQARAYIAEQRKTIDGYVDVTNSDEGGNVSTSRVKYSDKYGKQEGVHNILDGYEDLLNNQDDTATEQKRHEADEAENKRLQNQSKMTGEARAAQRKAEEEARKADQKRYDGFKTSEDALREYLGPEIVARDWEEFAKAFKAGSEKANEAVRESAASRQAADRAAAEAKLKAAEKYQVDQRNAWDMDHDAWETASHRTAADEAEYWSVRALEADKGSENERRAWDKATHALIEARKNAEDAARARSKAGYAKDEQAAHLQEATLAIEEQTGQISRHDAALEQAAIHAEQYTAKMQELREELERQRSLDANGAGAVNAQAAIDKADADRKVQVMQDAAQAAASTWQGALKDANAVWLQDSRDSAKEVAELYRQTMDGLNGNVVNAVTGDKTNWGGYFKGLGKTVAGDGLRRAESGLLGTLGLGKADGSATNPLHVKVVGGMGGPMGMSAEEIVKGFPGGSIDTGAMSSFASLAKSALSFIPGGSVLSGLFGGHRALGGGVKAGVTYDIGELGREEFTPATDGYITPTNKLSNGGASYQIYMDGGVTPEQVHLQITSALKAVHGKVVRDASNAVLERSARRPRSAG